MRKILGTVFQTIDGVMQAPGGPSEDPTDGFDLGGWQFGFPDEEAGEEIGKSLQPPYALLLGRRTYDIFSSYWPYHDSEDKAVADAFNAAEKFVMTHDDGPLEWAGSRRVSGFDELADIRNGEGPPLQIWGSSTLYPSLIEHGLLDRLTLITYPLVLGKGKRTFAHGTPPTTLRFECGKTTAEGTAVASFVPEPGVAIGESPPAKGNPTEAKRQEKIRGGKLVTLTLYGHAFSSYTWKALIAFYANETAFTFHQVNPRDAEDAAFLNKVHPFGKFPVLADGDTTIIESSTIIEYLADKYPGPAPLIPANPMDAITVRTLDRLFDNYVMASAQRVVNAYLRNADNPEPAEVEGGKADLKRAYAWLDGWLEANRFPPHVSLATCAAAPSLFYADWVERIPEGSALAALRAELLALPAVSRCVEDARPYRAYFPPGAPDRD